MSSHLRTLLLAGAAALASAAALPAAAQEFAGPRIVGSGENASVEYGAAPRGNILGGGRVTVVTRDGETIELMHLDEQFAQRRAEGTVAVVVGSGENRSVVYRVAPAASFATLASRPRG